MANVKFTVINSTNPIASVLDGTVFVAADVGPERDGESAGVTGLQIEAFLSGSFQTQGDALDALNALGVPIADGQFLVASGPGAFTYESEAVARASMGAGDVDGPGGAIDNAVTRWDGSTGTKIKASVVTIDDAGNIIGVNGITGLSTVAVDGSDLVLIEDVSDANILKVVTAQNIADLGGGSNSFETINTPAGTNPVAEIATDTLNLTSADNKFTITGDASTDTVNFAVIEANIDHDALANFVANEHINHASVILTAGTGLTGGGDITASRSFAVDGVLEDLDTLGAATLDGQFIVATGAGVFAYENGAAARASLGLVIGIDVQAFDAVLDSLSANSDTGGALEKTGANAVGTYPVTAAGKALLDDASASAQRTTLGLVIGIDVQAFDAVLDSLSANSDTGGALEKTGANAVGTYPVTAAGKALLDDTSASAQRTTLGLGSLATLSSVGTATIDDNSVTLAELEHGTQGGILYYAASGVPTRLPAGANGQFLKTQGAAADPVWDTAAGTGDVVGPGGASTDNFAAFADGTGKLIKDSGFSADDLGHVSGINAQTGTAYTLVLGDAEKLVTMDNGAPNELTVPGNASVAFPITTNISLSQMGVGITKIVAGGGVTLRSEGSDLTLRAQFTDASMVKIATDEWLVTGALALLAWNVSTASFLQSKSVSVQDALPQGLFFRADGLKMYIIGTDNGEVYEYDLSPAWDVDTRVFLQSKSVVAQDNDPTGLFFRADGLKMYIVGIQNKSVHEYNLSTAWDVDTRVFLQSKSVIAQDLFPTDLFFRADGLKMYIVGDGSDSVHEYDLSPAWDVSTASFLQSKDISAQDTEPHGLFFRADGLKMYTTGIGNPNDSVYEYDLSTAWDIGIVSFLQSKDVSVQDQSPLGVFFRADGRKMYIVGTQNSSVYEYDVG